MSIARPAVTGYLYPWDVLGDPGAAEAVAALNVDRVALAASYHSVRAATPRHPQRRVVDARTAALYVPVEAEDWQGHRLVPREAKEWAGSRNAFGDAAAGLRSAGLPVDAWTVLTHSSALGGLHPELCVRNAFGEIYVHALCPSHESVREYARTVVRQVLQRGQPDGLVLEAVGPLGFSHQHQHEKTDGADYSPRVQSLLSLCFCNACRHEYATAGLSSGDLEASVRSSVMMDDPAEDPSDASLMQEFLPLLEFRWKATARLLDEVLAEVASFPRDVRISIHASPDPWSTGPFAPVRALERSRLWLSTQPATAVLPCWGTPADSAKTLRSFRETATAARTGAYVLALPPKTADSGAFALEWQALLAEGCDELHVYHLGLASTARRNAIVGALDRLAESPSPP